MPRPDIAGDAARAFAVLRGGGIAILPMDVGYSLIGGSEAALKRIFETKGRAPDKLHAMLGDMALHRELHLADARGREIVEAITLDHGLPLGAIGRARMDHPILQQMTPAALEASTSGDTVLMLLNAGAFHAEICRLSREACHPLFGSSANRSLQGTKFRVDDMEPEIAAIADIVIDHGVEEVPPLPGVLDAAEHRHAGGRALRRLLRVDRRHHGAGFRRHAARGAGTVARRRHSSWKLAVRTRPERLSCSQIATPSSPAGWGRGDFLGAAVPVADTHQLLDDVVIGDPPPGVFPPGRSRPCAPGHTRRSRSCRVRAGPRSRAGPSAYHPAWKCGSLPARRQRAHPRWPCRSGRRGCRAHPAGR